MRFDFPQVDLPGEMLAWTDVTEDILNIYKQSCRLKAAIFAVCTEGSIKASINLIDYEIQKDDLITLLPGSIIQFRENTEKVRLCFAGFSSACVSRVNLIKMLVGVYTKITEYPVISLKQETAIYFNDYFSLLTRITCDESIEINSRITEPALSSVLAGIQMVYDKYSFKGRSSSRKEDICKELVQTVSHYYANERRAQFYADKLGISLQHLSTTVKQVMGKNVLDIIAYVVIMDAKAKLKSTDMTIQEITYSLNFPSASFFGKYFRRHVGMTPLDYRKS